MIIKLTLKETGNKRYIGERFIKEFFDTPTEDGIFVFVDGNRIAYHVEGKADDLFNEIQARREQGET